MNKLSDWIQEPARDLRVAARADVVVVGGGPAGLSAALAAARNGAEVILLERYNHLGGLASGGMVLVLDDMWDNHLNEISVRGTPRHVRGQHAARHIHRQDQGHVVGRQRQGRSGPCNRDDACRQRDHELVDHPLGIGCDQYVHDRQL